MTNTISLQISNMVQPDLGQQLQDLKNARPARPVRPTQGTDPFDVNRHEDLRPVERREPARKDHREDFNDVFSDQVQTQTADRPTEKPEQTSDIEQRSVNQNARERSQTTVHKRAEQAAETAQVNKGATENGKLNTAKGIQHAQLNDIALLTQKTNSGGFKADANALQELGSKTLPVTPTGQTLTDALDQNPGEATRLLAGANNLLNLKAVKADSKGKDLQKGFLEHAAMAQESSSKTSESPVQMKTQLTNQGNAEQQQPNTPQGQANNGDKNEQYVAAEQAAKSSQAAPEKSHLQGSQKTSKKFGSEFGIKGQTPAAKNANASAAKGGSVSSSSGLNKNFAQVQELIDPKVKVKIDGTDANIRVATEKAGEIAVRLQMKQEGVADVRLTGENAAAFDKKDELQAALQSEGLDLGKFNLSQDGHENERQEKAEDFEDDNLTVAETTNTKASIRRRKDGATLHVQA